MLWVHVEHRPTVEGAFTYDQTMKPLSIDPLSAPWLWRDSLEKSFTQEGNNNSSKSCKLMDSRFINVPPRKIRDIDSDSDYSDDDSESNVANGPTSMWSKIKEKVVEKKPSLFEIAQKALEADDEESELKFRVAGLLGR